VESAVTNKIRNNTMVGGAAGTLPTNWTKTADGSGVSIAVSGVGVESGINYVDLAFTGTATAAKTFYVFPDVAVANSPGQPYTGSMFTRLMLGTLPTSVKLRTTSLKADASDNEVFNKIITPTNSGLAGQRKSLTATSLSVDTVNIRHSLEVNVLQGEVVSFTLRIGMPQLEVGSKPSSVVPTSGSEVTRPSDVAGDGLLYSSLAEPEATWPAWNAATPYAVNAKVSYNHRRYVAVGASTGKNPATDVSTPPVWVDQGPTNQYAMFDSVIGTTSTSTSSELIVVLKLPNIAGISFMQMQADQAQISSVIDGVVQYSSTLNLSSGVVLNWFDYFTSQITRVTDYVITDIFPSPSSVFTIVLKAGSPVSIGNLVLGNIYSFVNTGCKATASSPTIGIIDYSVKVVDAFGNIKVVPRGYAKRMNVKLMLDSESVDKAASTLAAIRATPCVWIAADNVYQSLIVYGYYKDWEIEIAYTTKSYCSLQIEGLI
jgi:hypothetical protein